MENLLTKIEIPGKDFFDNNFNNVKLLKDDIDKKWILVEKEELDFDEVSYLEDQLKEEYLNNLSVYSLVSILDSHIPRKENQQFDVSKIYVSMKTYEIMKESDKKILSYIWSELYTPKKIDKEVGMLHLFSGFAVKDGLEDNVLYILNDVLKELD
jgi:phosphoketolase